MGNNKRHTGPNGHLSIRDSTPTQKGSYSFFRKNKNQQWQRKAVLYPPLNTIAINVNVYHYKSSKLYIILTHAPTLWSRGQFW